MGKVLKYLRIGLAALALAGCGRGNNTLQLSDESLCKAVSNKDSAVALYRQVDSTATLNSEERARYGILRAMYDYYTDRKPATDSVGQAVVAFFADATPLQQSLSHVCAGIIYEDLGEEGQALPHYVTAANLLRGSKQYDLLATLYSHWGWLLKVEPPYTESTVKLKQAEQYARLGNHTDKLPRILGQQGWALLFQEHLKEASAMFDRAIFESKRHHNIYLGWLYKSKASVLEMLHEHREALKYVDLALATASHEDKSLIGIKGTCYISLEQYDSARYYIEAGKLDEHYFQTAAYHSEMASLEEAQGNLQEALRQRRLYELYVDSQYEEDRNLALAQAEKRYNYAVVSADRDRYALENQRKTAIVIALVAVLCVVGFVAVYIHQRYRRRTERALRMKEDLVAQSLAQVKDRSLQLMRLQQEASDKENELLTSLNRKDEQLSRLRRQQRELKESILHTNDVIQKIESVKEMNEKKKIKQAPTIALSTDEMVNLLDSTNLCYDNFVDRLKVRFEDMTTDDLCLCCLLKLGISSQDQSLLLNTTDATLRTRKYRLKKKKMQLADEYQTLDDFVRVF